MSEPDPNHLKILDDHARNRGWIVGCYAQIEFILGHFVVECRRFPEYVHLTERLPYSLDTRVQKVSAILLTPGPLSHWNEAFSPLIDALQHFEELRHFLSHGLSELFVTPSYESQIRIRRFVPTKGNEGQVLEITVKPHELGQLADTLGHLAQQFMETVRACYLEQGLDAFPFK